VKAGEPLTCRAATRAENQGGVDASLEYPSGLSVPAQIVKAPSRSEYGAAVAKGLWRVVVTVDRAASSSSQRSITTPRDGNCGLHRRTGPP
jgi:hypothetical protein